METIYIRKSVQEHGLPKEEGWLFVLCDFPIADAIMQVAWFDNEHGFTIDGVTHYLSPVELPTEEEIEKAREFHAICNDSNLYEGNKMGFVGGINWLLNRLSGEGQKRK